MLQKLSDWDAFEDGVDGKSKYSIQGARHPNMTALQVVQRFFRSEPEIKCSNAIQLYQSLKEGKEKILLKKPSAEKEQTLGFTNLLQATTSVMGFVKRKIVVNESFCGEDKSKLQSLTSFDHLATMVPILSYAKNAIGRKFFKPDSMLHQLLTKEFSKIFTAEESKAILEEENVFSFDNFPRYVRNFCRFFDILTPCMQNSMEAEAESSACGIRWPDVKPWMETLPLRMCTRDSSGFIPSQPALKVLKANYGYAFSFLSCFLHDSDKLHNASSLSEAFQLEPLEKAIETCHADKFVGRLEGIFSAILKSNRDKEMDIMKIVDTIQTTANTTAAALRCLAKHLHPFCAQRKVDLGAAMKQVLPMISIGTFGIVNIPTKVSDYKAKLSLKTNDRVTLAVVGDPHVKSLKNPDKFETCSELEYFTYKSKYLYGSTDSPENFTFPKATFPTTTLDFTSTTPMPMPEYMSTTETPELESGADTDLLVAPEKTVLISNDWFRVEGTLARWSSSVTGTFFKEVKFIVGEQVSDDKADYVTYTFNSLTDLEYAPRFETSKKLSSGEVSLGEDAGVQFEGLTSVQSLPLRIYTQEVKGQKRVVIKELKSGTVIAFSNPSGEIVNTYVRSSRPLLEASTGLLVDGCPDAVDRSEVINKEKELRPKRSVDCNDVCADVDGFGDMCSYDCLAAQESGTEDDVVVSSYSSVEEVVSSVVESPVVDQELIADAVDEEETFTEVPTTTPSSIDLEASGGDLPVLDVENALNEAVEQNIDEDAQATFGTLTTTEGTTVSPSQQPSPLTTQQPSPLTTQQPSPLTSQRPSPGSSQRPSPGSSQQPSLETTSSRSLNTDLPINKTLLEQIVKDVTGTAPSLRWTHFTLILLALILCF